MPPYDSKKPQGPKEGAHRHLFSVPNTGRDASLHERLDHLAARITAGDEMLIEMKGRLDELKGQCDLIVAHNISVQSNELCRPGEPPAADAGQPVLVFWRPIRATLAVAAALAAGAYLAWGWLGRWAAAALAAA